MAEGPRFIPSISKSENTMLCRRGGVCAHRRGLLDLQLRVTKRKLIFPPMCRSPSPSLGMPFVCCLHDENNYLSGFLFHVLIGRPLNELMDKRYFLEIPYDVCKERRGWG